MNKIWVKPTRIEWLAIAFAVALLSGLCIWQIERLGEKQALLATLEHSATQMPLETLPETEAEMREAAWMRYRVHGEFLHDHEAHLAARYHRGTLGYHILTPFRLSDDKIILLNRGWVPSEKKEASTRPDSQPKGEQQLVVMLRADPDKNYFTPAHDRADNIWFWRDVAGIATHSGLEMLPVPADVVVENPPKDLLPIPSDGHIEIRNDHLGYAITWFLLDLAVIIMCILYYHRKPA